MERIHTTGKDTLPRPLALVGMSNVGKSYWAERLTHAGYANYSCDDEIERLLGAELAAAGYGEGLDAVARWMGQPYERRYGAAALKYLSLEASATIRALEAAKQSSQPFVIDTTGSVIYLPAPVLQQLCEHTTVVYLRANDATKAAMTEQYFARPKPVIWGDVYRQLPGETPQQALRRNYPALLAVRAAMYANLAHVTLDQTDLAAITDTSDFIDLVQHA